MELQEKINKLLIEWHEAGKERHTKVFPSLDYNHSQVKTARYAKKFVWLDEGNSGMFGLEIETGNIYKIKAYGVINRKKLIGHIDTVTGEQLSKYEWY